MSSREIFFTFNKDVKIDKKAVLQFVDEYEYYIEEDFKNIKKEFGIDTIDMNFLKMFIEELVKFDCVSIKNEDVHAKQCIVKNFIYDTVCNEEKVGDGIFEVRYLYDEWDYEGCGSSDHYYLTYIDDKKMIKKMIKKTRKQVKKLIDLGVNAELVIS